VLSVVASRVTIEVEFPEGIRPVRILGRDGRVGENHVEVTLNQLYGGQRKYALIEVELPEGSEGEVRKVADARCRYQNMIANSPASSSGHAMVRYSRSREEIAHNVNVEVGKVIFLNEYADAQAQAIIHADNKDYDKAAELLRSNSVAMKEYAIDNSLPDLEQQADEVRQQAEEIQDKGLAPEGRKKMTTTNFQIYNQQQMESPGGGN
jgi:Ca-activated chloride channel family protein